MLFSGGLDSTVALHEAPAPVIALSVNYGAKHNRREIEYAVSQCDVLGVEHRIIEIDLSHLSSGLLLGQAGSVVVPGRNAILISLAASVAERRSCAVFGGDSDQRP